MNYSLLDHNMNTNHLKELNFLNNILQNNKLHLLTKFNSLFQQDHKLENPPEITL